jgi:DNA-binding MarR family transcriptional regulator
MSTAQSEPERVVTLIALLRRTSQQMVAELVERLHAAGYPDHTAGHHPIFENIDPKGTRLTELGARTGLTHQSVGELVDALESRGYVERVPDPSDRRARLVRLTPKGRGAVSTAIREISAIESKWLQRWRRSGLRGDLRAALESGLRDESRQSNQPPR